MKGLGTYHNPWVPAYDQSPPTGKTMRWIQIGLMAWGFYCLVDSVCSLILRAWPEKREIEIVHDDEPEI